MKVLNKYHFGGGTPRGAVNIMRGSDFGNPYVIGKHGTRAEVIDMYRHYLQNRIINDPEFKAKVRNLYGKDLLCCCKPAPCHGDVLVRAATYLRIHEPDGSIDGPQLDLGLE